MAFSFDLGLAISAERYGAISAGPEHSQLGHALRWLFHSLYLEDAIEIKQELRIIIKKLVMRYSAMSIQ